MPDSMGSVLRDQGRGITGALLVVGLSFLYTMETWWLGWRLPLPYLLGYALGGLVVVFLITRNVGFRAKQSERKRRNLYRDATDFTELVLQSFVAAYGVLLAFGVVELGDSLITVVRMGLIQVVPLGFGASVANQLLARTDESVPESTFPRNLAVFGLGAAFVAFPIAPTQEIEVIAVHAGWSRLAALVVLSIGTVYLVLFELEFRGHGSRIERRSAPAHLGTSFVAYAVGAAVSVVLLAAFGHFAGTTFAEWVAQTIVLSFLAAVGASAGEVVL